MNSATTNIVIISADSTDNNIISGKAIDGDISIDYQVYRNNINLATFLPEANLVVHGFIKINDLEICSVHLSIKNIVAVVSLPIQETSVEAPASNKKTPRKKVSSKV